MALIKQKIVPHLWFDTEGKEAARFTARFFLIQKFSVLPNCMTLRRENVMWFHFSLSGQSFMAISAGPLFKFNESISFIVNCDTQEEINYYWEQLSAVPEAEQCGWLKDQFGLSWQIVPSILDEMMQDEDPERVARVTQAFLRMKKFDVVALHAAYNKHD